MKLRSTLFAPAGVILVFALAATVARGDVLVFKDGFKIEGRIKQENDWFSDPHSGASFSIPKQNRPYWLDDGIRNIYFPPFQLVEAQKDRAKNPEEIRFILDAPFKGARDPLPATWKLDQTGK